MRYRLGHVRPLVAVVASLALIASSCGEDGSATESESTAEEVETSTPSAPEATASTEPGTVSSADDAPVDETATTSSTSLVATTDGSSPVASEDQIGALCAAEALGPITIINLNGKSGEGPGLIDDFANGVELAADSLNETCGTEIVRVERISTDFSPSGLEPNLLQAQETEGVSAMIGPGSSSQLVLNNVVTEGEIPMLWPVATASAIRGAENGSDWAFNLRAVNDAAGLVQGQVLVDQGATKVWLECTEGQYGISGCDNATTVLEANGIEVVNRVDGVSTSETDFTQSMIDLPESGADAVGLFVYPGSQAAFTQQLDDNGLLSDFLLLGSVTTETLVATGVLSTEQAEATVAVLECNPREDDPDVNERYRDAFGVDMTSLAAVVYDAVHMIVDAAVRENDKEPQAIRDGLAATSWSGVCQDYFDSGSGALAHKLNMIEFPGGVITKTGEILLDESGTKLAD